MVSFRLFPPLSLRWLITTGGACAIIETQAAALDAQPFRIFMFELLGGLIQVSANGDTVWVHHSDGSTVGRFSLRFGMDVHTTITHQLNGGSQCLHCTHGPATEADWAHFIELMRAHYDVTVPVGIIKFPKP